VDQPADLGAGVQQGVGGCAKLRGEVTSVEHASLLLVSLTAVERRPTSLKVFAKRAYG
jgi:hypothetical protein